VTFGQLRNTLTGHANYILELLFFALWQNHLKWVSRLHPQTVGG